MLHLQQLRFVDVHVGKQVQAQRILRGMSQAELAEQLGLTHQQVQKYETGANRISAGRLWEMSKVLDVPISCFFEGLNREQNAATEALDIDAAQKFVDDLEASPQQIKTASSLLLKSMAEGPKPRPRKTAK